MLVELPASRWNAAAAAHLLNRAGFGGTPEEIATLARKPLREAVTSMVAPEASSSPTKDPSWARPDPDRGARLKAFREASPEERTELLREQRKVQRARMIELEGWWLTRMASSSHPLQEKLTLFWHGHFATSAVKVRDAYLMWRQNDLFRRHGLGPWKTLLREVTLDPAMLIWLDQAQSRPPRPNENYARELMELFVLGEGRFSERDVTETARALTGWTLDRLRQEPVFRPRLHDSGIKSVLGLEGKLGLDDILELLTDRPDSDRWITGRLWTFFAGTPPPPGLQDALAGGFRDAGRRIAPFLETLFISEAFHAPEVVGQKIKSPTELLVMACRQLDRPLPPAPICANSLRLLGQDLFHPPNVKGWEGGVAWINANTLLSRHNLALTLVTGGNPLPNVPRKPDRTGRSEHRRRQQVTTPVELKALIPLSARTSKERTIAILNERFLDSRLSDRGRKVLLEHLSSQGDLDRHALLGLLRLTLCLPEYQLC